VESNKRSERTEVQNIKMRKAIDLLDGYMEIFPPRKKKIDDTIESICKEKPSDVDVLYRAEVARNPVNSEVWLGWMDQRDDDAWCKNVFFEMALSHVPRSYKLWKRYLELNMNESKKLKIGDPSYDRVNVLFERAIINLYQMPKLWIMFAEYLIYQKKVTKSRRVLDEALRKLPVTLHQRIWEVYISFLKMIGNNIPSLSVSIWKRYLQLQPQHKEIFIQFLLSNSCYDEAAVALSEIVNEEAFVSLEGKTRHEMWLELCELVSEHAPAIKSIDVEHVLKTGIRRFADDTGRLWNWLANYYVALGQYERARDVYEDGLGSISTVKDFSLIFAAYTEFEETIVEKISDAIDDKTLTAAEKAKLEEQNEFHLCRLAHIIDRRAEILSRVKLRMNPNNSYEWLNRARLFEKLGQSEKVLQTYAEATKTIEPENVLGPLSKIWMKFSEFYEKNGEMEMARTVLMRGLEAPASKMDDIASLWCELVEFSLRRGDKDKALGTIRDAVHRPKIVDRENLKSFQNQLWKSQRLWSLALDVEENFGTLETLKAIFDRMCDLKVISTQQLLNYAQVLESKNYFEASFAVYETGIDLLAWPQLYNVWLIYLSKFCSRYEGTKLERSRELFERALSNVPAEYAKRLFIMYMNMEEEYGLSRQALDVLVRSVDKVKEDERWSMYKLLISKTIKLFGILKTRPIFEKCLADIESEDERREASLMFSKVERGLGEINRARAILSHGSQFADPNVHLTYWNDWREFEVMHGNEETFREMLRTKRIRM